MNRIAYIVNLAALLFPVSVSSSAVAAEIQITANADEAQIFFIEMGEIAGTFCDGAHYDQGRASELMNRVMDKIGTHKAASLAEKYRDALSDTIIADRTLYCATIRGIAQGDREIEQYLTFDSAARRSRED